MFVKLQSQQFFYCLKTDIFGWYFFVIWLGTKKDCAYTIKIEIKTNENYPKYINRNSGGKEVNGKTGWKNCSCHRGSPGNRVWMRESHGKAWSDRNPGGFF